jgi:hypothetical protein
MVVNQLYGNKKIKIIQGDSYTYQIQFVDESISDLVDRIVFSSTALEISEDMTVSTVNSRTVYTYEFSALDTADLDTSLFYTFDITVYFIDGKVISQSGLTIQILQKENPVVVA